MKKQSNNWKEVTVTNVPEGGRFIAFEEKDDYSEEMDILRDKTVILSSGEVKGGTVSFCFYNMDYVVRVRFGGMLPVEFRTSMLDDREKALIEMREDK